MTFCRTCFLVSYRSVHCLFCPAEALRRSNLALRQRCEEMEGWQRRTREEREFLSSRFQEARALVERLAQENHSLQSLVSGPNSSSNHCCSSSQTEDLQGRPARNGPLEGPQVRDSHWTLPDIYAVHIYTLDLSRLYFGVVILVTVVHIPFPQPHIWRLYSHTYAVKSFFWSIIRFFVSEWAKKGRNNIEAFKTGRWFSSLVSLIFFSVGKQQNRVWRGLVQSQPDTTFSCSLWSHSLDWFKTRTHYTVVLPVPLPSVTFKEKTSNRLSDLLYI